MHIKALATLAILVFFMLSRSDSEPRGIRNNNPGNIRDTAGDTWQGQQGTDGEFAIFETPEFGLRALARLLQNYREVHGLRSVRGIISRYAPTNENNTSAYINHVSSALGVSPDDSLQFPTQLPGLMAAIIKHENGKQPYSAEQIAMGIEWAST